MTRRELMRRMDMDELREWAAYERIEPFLRERLDWNMAKLDWVIRSIVSKKPVKIDDCLLVWGDSGKSREPQSTEQMRASLSALMSAASEGKRGS